MRSHFKSAAVLVPIVVLVACAALDPAAAQEYPAGQTPDAQGYILAIHNDSAFDVIESLHPDQFGDVTEEHIMTTPKTVFWKPIVDQGRQAFTNDSNLAKKLAVGDKVRVFGKRIKHTHEILASVIVLEPKYEHLDGSAVVERVVATSPRVILEADGYYIATTRKTLVQYRPPLAKNSAPAPNLWIEYNGRWNRDGLVAADRITYFQFDPNSRTNKGLRKSEQKLVPPVYATANGGAAKAGKIKAQYIVGHQNTASIPADAAMQQRVQQIGESLIPPCQKNLPENDPQKIHFQFYAVDDRILFQALGSPHGIILVPEQVVEKMQNDDQLAAVLAQGVAEALEWQVLPKAHNPAAPDLIQMGEDAGPYAGLALMSVGLYMELHGNYPSHFDPYQTARVSLSLMHDAGYDVMQAPIAWQQLGLAIAAGYAMNPAIVEKTYLEEIIGQEYSHDLDAIAAAGRDPYEN